MTCRLRRPAAAAYRSPRAARSRASCGSSPPPWTRCRSFEVSIGPADPGLVVVADPGAPGLALRCEQAVLGRELLVGDDHGADPLVAADLRVDPLDVCGDRRA